MSGSLANVALAALVFVGGHFALSSLRLRTPLIGRLGERGFRILYASGALASMVWLVIAYRDAPDIAVWPASAAARAITAALMILATLFVVFGATTRPGASADTVLAITRHPVMWGIALFAVAHLVANGDAASIVLFGGFAILALGGAFHIDDRARATGSEEWCHRAATTSMAPFVAIASGRARVPARLLWNWRLAVSAVVYAALFGLHGPVIGVAPYPS